MNENTTAIKEQGDSYTVATESGLEITTDYVLDATGRRPNVHGIGITVTLLFNRSSIFIHMELNAFCIQFIH